MVALWWRVVEGATLRGAVSSLSREDPEGGDVKVERAGVSTCAEPLSFDVVGVDRVAKSGKKRRRECE